MSVLPALPLSGLGHHFSGAHDSARVLVLRVRSGDGLPGGGKLTESIKLAAIGKMNICPYVLEHVCD